MKEENQPYINEILDFMKRDNYKPLTVQELAKEFNTEDAESFKEFVKALVIMEEKGLIIRARNDRYGLPEQMNFVKGKVSGHAKGFAFVVPEKKMRVMYLFPLLKQTMLCTEILCLQECHQNHQVLVVKEPL